MISETVYGILSVAAGITTITTNIFPVVIPQKANPPATVSYTHLTLPTSDLV